MRRNRITLLGLAVIWCLISAPVMALTAVDIGSPNTPGTTVETATDVTMTTDGPSFWNASDNGHFAYETMTGDGTVTVRFASYTNGQTYSKCGIMFRESLDANAMNAFVCVRPAATLFQRRTATSGGTVKTEAYGQTPPKWLRLTRSGNDFSAYHSDDGTTWTQLGTAETIAMSSTIYVGLAASSGDAAQLITATFDNITGLTPPNTPPTADAGSDQLVTDADDSGSESVTLDGSGSTDSDGTIASYIWEENSSQIATGVSPSVLLTQGVHTITLTVTDDGGETDTDTVVVTVNDPPTANAGADQTVTDADNSGSESVTLDGSASVDADGSIASYSWEENSSQIATGSSPSVSLTTGSHTITLIVTDNDGGTDSDTVVVNVNIPPVAAAGADQTVNDADDSGSEQITLDASGSSDSDGTIASYVWEENSTQIGTGINPIVSLAVGVHNITLTVTDDDGGTNTDTVVIDVTAYVNIAPTAAAGSDQTVTDNDDDGSETVTLDASASSDSDGTIASYVWEEASTQIATGVSPAVSLAVGTHTIDLTVTDDDGATDTDTVVITVDAAPAAGAPVVLDFTQNGTDLEITAERSDQSEQFWTLVIDENRGVIKTFYDLTSVAGTNFNFASPYGSGAGLFSPYDTDIRNSAYAYTAGAKVDGQSSYIFTLYEDDGTAQRTITVTINVPDENGTLIAAQTSSYYTNAAASAQLATPAMWLNAATETEMNAIYTVTLQNDLAVDGTLWVDAEVANSPEAAALNLPVGRNFRLTALDYTDGQLDYGDAWGLTWHSSFLAQAGLEGGIYDGWASKPPADTTVVTNSQLSIDIIALTVVNELPVADAGSDQTVTDNDDDGSESVTLDGSASSDIDGTIASYLWEENSSQIATGVSPSVTLLVGTHTIDLTVTDDLGGTDTDTVVITVDPHINLAPTADAGSDQTVTDTDDGGDEVVTLDASASTDSDGTIASYVWEENSSQIATGVSPSVTLLVGTHNITLTVTDDDGATDTDTVVVTVDPAPAVNPLTGIDIGSPSISGSLSYANDTYSVTGGGAALWGSSDAFYFAYTQITGDATITVRQASITNIQTYTKTGIMIRESLDANSMNVLAGTRGTGYATFQRRTSTGGTTLDTRVSGSAPVWLRLVRSGNDFSVYSSTDGSNWTQIGTTETIAMSSTVYVGLAMSAGNDTEAVTAAYDNVTGLGAAPPSNVAPVADAGSDQTVTDSDDSGTEQVTLDGTGSTDSDGSIVSYLWEENSSQIGTGDMPVVTLDVGSHTITLTVTDDDSATDTDTVVVTVNQPTGPQPPTVQTISEYKSGISLDVLGTYGTDYLVEQWYHDPKIDPRCTIYINSDVDLDLFHNAKNMNIIGEDVDSYVIIGADGADGIPDSGDEGIIRYRVDQEMTTRAKWAEHTRLYPAWTGPASFDDFEYDPGDSVVGVTGALPGGDISDPTTFYWRGMLDSVGDEWHVIAVGDDDTTLQSYYANRSSDGKIYYFIVNPITPAMTIIKNDSAAQFYVTPPKTYFVPVIKDQIAYVLGDCDIELAALGASQVEYSLQVEGQTESWQVYSVPINTVTANLQSDTRYELKYRIGSAGAVKTRIVHYDPAYPSDTEVHPKNLFWENGAAGIQRIRDRLHLEPYASNYDDYLNSSFAHQRDGAYAATIYTGDRWCGIRMQLLASAFPLLIDGFAQHPDCSAFLKNAMLDTFMNLDPVGMEHVWAQNSPSREINKQGYYGVTRPLANAIAYDWVIKDLRAGTHQHGFTAVEDYKLRDNLATFANWTMYTHTKQLNIDVNGFNVGMWSGAWTHGTAIIAAVMEDYDSDLYGTSGAPGGTYNAPRPWTPFPDYPLTWWDVCNNKNVTISGTPNLNMKSTFWGLINEYDEEWYDRRGYWGGSMMGWLYYTTMNFRANFDGYHYTHIDNVVKKIAEGGQIMPGKSPEEGPLEFYTAMLVNHHFPTIAPVELDKLDDGTNIYEKNVNFSVWLRGPLGIMTYEYDWDQ